MGDLLELFARVFFEVAVVATGHGIGWLMPMRRKLTDDEAGIVGLLFWLAVLLGAVWWRLG